MLQLLLGVFGVGGQAYHLGFLIGFSVSDESSVGRSILFAVDWGSNRCEVYGEIASSQTDKSLETMNGKVDEHSCQCRSTNRHVLLGLFCMRKASLSQELLTAFQAGCYAGCSP